MAHDYSQLAAGVRQRVLDWQQTIHADPEVGFDTVRTATLVANALRDAKMTVRERIGRTGVVGDIDVPGATRRVAFRADMDALPMDEENDLPHKSRNPGAAHMCGHDAHTSMLLGAAQVLSEIRDALPCSMRFIFQPNEEAWPGGAPAMIADGCLEGVDRIFGMHVWPLIDTGSIGIREGAAMAQPDTFQVVLRGKGGHAAAPQENHDPVVAAAHIVTALQSIVARNVNPIDSGVVSVTQVHAGSADNVIPERVVLGGTIRSFRQEVGDVVRRRFTEVVEGVARSFEIEADVKVIQGYPVLVNDAEACAEAERSIGPVVPVRTDVQASLGGEDFAYYLEKVSGAFVFLGNRDLARGIQYFCHHPRFQVDDEAMAIGVKAWLALALGAGR